MKIRVFLGGTCNNSTWRDKLIPLLDEKGIEYFNPVTDNWNEEFIKLEDIEKNEKCNIHLYVITKEMKGVYSIAEAVDSAWSIDYKNLLTTIFYVIEDGFSKEQIRSFRATANLISNINDRAIGYVGKENLNELANNLDFLNSAFKESEELPEGNI